MKFSLTNEYVILFTLKIKNNNLRKISHEDTVSVLLGEFGRYPRSVAHGSRLTVSLCVGLLIQHPAPPQLADKWNVLLTPHRPEGTTQLKYARSNQNHIPLFWVMNEVHNGGESREDTGVSCGDRRFLGFAINTERDDHTDNQVCQMATLSLDYLAKGWYPSLKGFTEMFIISMEFRTDPQKQSRVLTDKTNFQKAKKEVV